MLVRYKINIFHHEHEQTLEKVTPPLEVFKIWLNRTVRNPFQLHLLLARGWTKWPSKNFSKWNYSMVVCLYLCSRHSEPVDMLNVFLLRLSLSPVCGQEAVVSLNLLLLLFSSKQRCMLNIPSLSYMDTEGLALSYTFEWRYHINRWTLTYMDFYVAVPIYRTVCTSCLHFLLLFHFRRVLLYKNYCNAF